MKVTQIHKPREGFVSVKQSKHDEYIPSTPNFGAMLDLSEQFNDLDEGLREEADYPWLRREEESALWYARFVTYLKLGHHRSLTNVYRIENSFDSSQRVTISPAWYDAAHDFEWKERAAAFDQHQGELLTELELQEKLKARDLRRSILQSAGNQFAEALESMPEVRDWKEAADFIKAWTTSVREEYNDLPVSKVETSATVTYRVVQELTNVFVAAFMEVNTIADPDQRREALASKIKELQGQVA